MKIFNKKKYDCRFCGRGVVQENGRVMFPTSETGGYEGGAQPGMGKIIIHALSCMASFCVLSVFKYI